MVVAQQRAGLDHALQRRLLFRQLGDAEPDRQVAGEPLAQPHGADIAQMARHRFGRMAMMPKR